MSKKSRTQLNLEDSDLIFTFKYCSLDVECNPDIYDDVQILKIKQIVRELSKEIVIDKTYVKYEGTKFEKTFITKHGWKDFCKILIDTRWGNKCTKYQNQVILEAYKMFIKCYIAQCLIDFGYDIDAITLDLTENSRFMSIVERDTIHAWKDYPGKWQTWSNK